MAANDSKAYFSSLDKLVDHFNNNYHLFINKKPINAEYSALTKKIQTNFKAPSFFEVKKQRPKTNLEKCYQTSVSNDVPLDLKVSFPLVTC